MNDIIKKIITGVDIQHIIEYVETNKYKNGPKSITDMEILCYLCLYQKRNLIEYKIKSLNSWD